MNISVLGRTTHWGVIPAPFLTRVKGGLHLKNKLIWRGLRSPRLSTRYLIRGSRWGSQSLVGGQSSENFRTRIVYAPLCDHVELPTHPFLVLNKKVILLQLG
jgi:hypothetical protein